MGRNRRRRLLFYHSLKPATSEREEAVEADDKKQNHYLDINKNT